MSTILLSSLVPACSAGPRLRDKISVWWSTWHSEPVSQVHFSLIGELTASLEVAEVARTAAGRPLSSTPLESTWSLRFHYWHAVLPAVLNSRIHRSCPRLIPSSATVTVRLLRFSLDKLTPASLGAHRSTLSTRSSPLHQTTSLDSSVPWRNHGSALR